MKGIAFEFLRTLLNQSDPISIIVHVTVLCNVFEQFMAAACDVFCQSNVGFSEVK